MMTDASSATAELPPLLLLFDVGFLGLLATSVAAWVWFFVNFKQLRSWSGWLYDRRSSRVGLIDLIGCICCMIVAQFLIFGVIVLSVPKSPNATTDVSVIADQDTATLDAAFTDNASSQESAKPEALPKWIAPVMTLSYVIGGLLTIMLVWIRTGATPRQLGIVGPQGIRDARVGTIAFFLVTPVILVVSSFVSGLTKVEYDHPVIDAMKDYPWTFPLLFIGAVICAPLWEEFAFRGLLIRWFDSIRQSQGSLRTILLGGGTTKEPFPPDTTDTLLDSNPMETGNPYQPPASTRLEIHPDACHPSIPAVYPPWWPAIFSGVLFGLAHFSYGISWIPLILFGIILGRLFQLRQSILPCVVLHACFNCLSMLGMAAQIFSK